MSAGFQQSSDSPSSIAPALLPHEMKSPTAFRTISEVADDLSLPQHVLRFWESKFQQIKPLKRGGGRRYYRPEDIKIIHVIKELLYNQGFTIRGVQKLMRESGGNSLARSMVPQPQLPMSIPAVSQQQASAAMNAMADVQAAATQDLPPPPPGLSSDKRRELQGVLAELKSMRKLLQQSGI